MTWYALSHPPCQRNFNPHPHTEDDVAACRSLLPFQTFQSTSSHGGWPYYKVYNDWFRDISIHILTRRMTRRRVKTNADTANFNPHPHTEDDINTTSSSWVKTNFNPHPHTEDDFLSLCRIRRMLIFQSTSSHGGWRDTITAEKLNHMISIHILTRRMTLSI